MKIKTNRNHLKGSYKTIINVGYCNLQNLLSHLEPLYYNSGIYGWNYDVYHVGGSTCICTGYRTIGNHAPYEIVERYEAKAKEIRQKSLAYHETALALCDLLEAFVQEVKGTNK